MAYIKTGLRYLLAGVLILAGVTHFTNTPFFTPMLEDFLPFPLALVYLSGVAEIACGLLLAIPKTSRWGGWAVIALMIAVFPANLRMALQPERFAEYGSATAMYVRLPMQALPILWAYWYTRAKPSTGGPKAPSPK